MGLLEHPWACRARDTFFKRIFMTLLIGQKLERKTVAYDVGQIAPA